MHQLQVTKRLYYMDHILGEIVFSLTDHHQSIHAQTSGFNFEDSSLYFTLTEATYLIMIGEFSLQEVFDNFCVIRMGLFSLS